MTREEAVRDYGGLVEAIARTLARRHNLPLGIAGLEMSDLVSDGMTGLLEAVGRFDPARASFGTYASRRIAGAIMDGLRRMDYLRRGQRRRAHDQGFDPEPPKSLETLAAAVLPADSESTPEEQVIEAAGIMDTRAALRRAWANLPPRLRKVLWARIGFGMTLAQIAARERVSLSRIAELEEVGLDRLRVAFGVQRGTYTSTGRAPRRRRKEARQTR